MAKQLSENEQMNSQFIDDVVSDNIALLMSLNQNLDSQPKLARKSGVGQSTIGRILRKDTSPTLDSLAKIARALGVSLFELMDPQLSSTRQYAPGVAEAKARYRMPGPYAEVPLLEAFYHGGNGEGMEHPADPEFLKMLSFRADWLEYEELNRAMLACAMIHGDSMEPTLHEADVVLIDLAYNSLNTVQNGSVYALTYQGKPLVKRVIRQELGDVVLESDNHRYKDITLSEQQADDLRIIGRVVWAGGKVK